MPWETTPRGAGLTSATAAWPRRWRPTDPRREGAPDPEARAPSRRKDRKSGYFRTTIFLFEEYVPTCN
jgi:hypothetical protein